MGWKLKGKPQTVKVTAKLAHEWAEMDAANTDRPLSERRLNVYKKILAEGGFRPVSWAKVHCKETDQDYRVNGKHTSTAFDSVDLKQFPDLYAVIEAFECETLEDVARLYSTFDSRTQMRTVSDINHSFASAIPELAEVPLATINLAVAALGFELWPTTEGGHAGAWGKGGKTSVDRAELLFDNVDVVLWLDKLIQKGPSMYHLFRQPVAAAMVGSWRKNKGQATEFWTAVRDETDPDPEAASRQLGRWLLTRRVATGNGSRAVPSRYKVEPREFYVRCVKYWNAWREGQKNPDVRYYTDHDLPAIK